MMKPPAPWCAPSQSRAGTVWKRFVRRPASGSFQRANSGSDTRHLDAPGEQLGTPGGATMNYLFHFQRGPDPIPPKWRRKIDKKHRLDESPGNKPLRAELDS